MPGSAALIRRNFSAIACPDDPSCYNDLHDLNLLPLANGTFISFQEVGARAAAGYMSQFFTAFQAAGTIAVYVSTPECPHLFAAWT